MTWKETAICVMLACWLLLTVCYTLLNKRMAKFTKRWDIFRWLSSYQMFSRMPRQFNLYYRDKSGSGAVSDWLPVQLVVPPKWYNVLWYPEGMTRVTIISAVDDIAVQLSATKNSDAESAVEQRFIYKIIVGFIRRIPAGSDILERQFKIEEDLYPNYNESLPRSIYQSEFFKV